MSRQVEPVSAITSQRTDEQRTGNPDTAKAGTNKTSGAEEVAPKPLVQKGVMANSGKSRVKRILRANSSKMIVFGTVCALGLSACSGSGASDAAQETASPSTAATQKEISPPLPSVPELDNATGIRSSASLTQCATERGAVTASGEVNNPGGEAADIVLTVDWVTSESDVVARGYALLRGVAAGKTEPWQATAQLDYDGPVTCVLTARSGVVSS